MFLHACARAVAEADEWAAVLERHFHHARELPVPDLAHRAAERDEPPFILVLDSLEDPHNVGTLLRSAEAAGVHGVLFPTHRQAPLSPSAVKASAGAIEHLLLCPVDDLPGALSDLHARGVRVAGAEGDAPMTARQSDLRGPLAIVVGSEGQGLGPAVRRRCDLFMRIPMKGAVGSLNAAVAGSILLFEALAQRDPNAMPTVAPQLPDAAHDEGAMPAATTVEPATPPAKRRSARTPRAAATGSAAGAEPTTGSAATPPAQAVGASVEVGDTAPPKPPRRKTAPTDPGAGASPESMAASPESEAADDGILREAAAVEPVTAEPARKPRARKGLSTEPADASIEAAPAPPENELLPADGPRKKSLRAR